MHTPSPHRRVLTTWLAVYPTITLALAVLGRLTGHLPLLLRTLALTAVVVVPIVGYAVLPALHRLDEAHRRRAAQTSGPGRAGEPRPGTPSSQVKTSREIMEILEAYDLTGSYRAAAELVGCDHHTVARYAKLRAQGERPASAATGSGRSTSTWTRSRNWSPRPAAGSARTSCTAGAPVGALYFPCAVDQ
jgi:hypothetical protein